MCFRGSGMGKASKRLLNRSRIGGHYQQGDAVSLGREEGKSRSNETSDHGRI